MHNGSLDANISEFLLEHKQHLCDAEHCNELVELLADWLGIHYDWPNYIVFRGSRLELKDDALGFIARYYIMLERSRNSLQQIRLQPLPDLVNIDVFFQTKDHEYNNLKALLNDISLATNYIYNENSSSVVDIVQNYMLSRFEFQQTVEKIPNDITFINFRNYETQVNEILTIAKLSLEKARLKIEQWTKVLNMRLQYNCIQRKIESLETF